MKTKPKLKLPGVHRQLKYSINFIYTYKKLILGTSVLAVVVNLILRLGGGEAVVFYQSVWFVLALSALVWAVRHAGDKRTNPTVRKAYYNGTAPFLKLILVIFVLSLVTIPFSVGAFLYSAVGLVTAASNSWWEQAIGIGLWSIFAASSLVLLMRLIFAIPIVSLPDVWPVQSLRMSWHLSKGKTGALVGRVLLLIFYTVALVALLGYVLNLTPLNESWQQGLVDVFSIGFVLPLYVVYTFGFYNNLK